MTLQDNMIKTVETFKKYAAKDGKGDTLSKGELFELAKAEFPLLCQHQKKDEILNEIYKEIDRSKDNAISLKEFVVFLSCLTIAIGEGM